MCALGGGKAHDGGVYAVSMASGFPGAVAGSCGCSQSSERVPQLDALKQARWDRASGSCKAGDVAWHSLDTRRILAHRLPASPRSDVGAGHGCCLRPLPTETGRRVTRVSFAQISWSPDSTHLLSASGDKTSKVWDVGANSVVNTFTMGSNILDQQLGCLWQNDHLLSISLSGYINYLDKNNPSKPLRVIKVRTCRGQPRLRGGRGRGAPA